MKSPDADARLIEAARDYHEPPSTPRERMWARIDAHRAQERPRARAGAWYNARFWWPVAAAAILLVGIGIGRLSHRGGPEPDVSRPSSPELRLAESGEPKLSGQELDRPLPDGPAAKAKQARENDQIFRYAAVPVLGQAELLLTQFRSCQPQTVNEPTFSARAASLLLETRMLLDSPAAGDAELGPLLADLELLLARIVRMAGCQDTQERTWVEQSLRKNAILPRLHAEIPTGPSPLSS
jgi:hypothetical protein